MNHSKLEELTDAQLRKRAISLDDSLRHLSAYATEDELEELQSELDLVQEERQRRHFTNQTKKPKT